MHSGSPLTSPTRQPTPSGSTSPPSQSHNPLSLRLYKVLATNFDDESTKEALSTLAELYAPTPTGNGHVPNGKGKGRVVNGDVGDEDDEDEEQYIDFDDDEDEMGASKDRWNRIATSVVVPGELVPGETAARARKNLKRDVQTRLAESSRMFLTAFAEVDKVSTCHLRLLDQGTGGLRPVQQLDTLQGHIDAMRTRCDDAQNQLAETNESCKSLLDRAGSLREQRCVHCQVVAFQNMY